MLDIVLLLNLTGVNLITALSIRERSVVASVNHFMDYFISISYKNKGDKK